MGRHEGLWFNLGHGHFGLMVSATTGEIIAREIARERSNVDLRFCGPLCCLRFPWDQKRVKKPLRGYNLLKLRIATQREIGCIDVRLAAGNEVGNYTR
jgi:hypothetical protein